MHRSGGAYGTLPHSAVAKQLGATAARCAAPLPKLANGTLGTNPALLHRPIFPFCVTLKLQLIIRCRTKGLMLQPVRQNEPTDPWAMAANLNTAANATASGFWGGFPRF